MRSASPSLPLVMLNVSVCPASVSDAASGTPMGAPSAAPSSTSRVASTISGTSLTSMSRTATVQFVRSPPVSAATTTRVYDGVVSKSRAAVATASWPVVESIAKTPPVLPLATEYASTYAAEMASQRQQQEAQAGQEQDALPAPVVEDDDADDDVMVTVAGEQVPLADVTPELEAKMTPAEYDDYFAVKGGR